LRRRETDFLDPLFLARSDKNKEYRKFKAGAVAMRESAHRRVRKEPIS
jgi:hypothetical protein